MSMSRVVHGRPGVGSELRARVGAQGSDSDDDPFGRLCREADLALAAFATGCAFDQGLHVFDAPGSSASLPLKQQHRFCVRNRFYRARVNQETQKNALQIQVVQFVQGHFVR